jgi:hypothetical protein
MVSSEQGGRETTNVSYLCDNIKSERERERERKRWEKERERKKEGERERKIKNRKRERARRKKAAIALNKKRSRKKKKGVFDKLEYVLHLFAADEDDAVRVKQNMYKHDVKCICVCLQCKRSLMFLYHRADNTTELPFL